MARMYPEPIRPNTQSDAERKLYAAFEAQLADPYVVFHSVAWQIRDTREGVLDGERVMLMCHSIASVMSDASQPSRLNASSSSSMWPSAVSPMCFPRWSRFACHIDSLNVTSSPARYARTPTA